MFKRLSLICIILSMAYNSHAQNFVWNKVKGGSNVDNTTSMCKSGSGQYTYITGYSYKNPKNASTILDSVKLNTSSNILTFICKIDTSGKTQWAKKCFEGSIVTNNIEIISDSNDNLYYLVSPGSGIDSMRMFTNTPLVKDSANLGFSLLIKIDKNGNFVWQRVFRQCRTIFKPLKIHKNKIIILLTTYKNNFIVLNYDTIKNSNFVFIQLDFNNNILKSKSAFQLINSIPQNYSSIVSFDILNDSIKAIVMLKDSIKLSNNIIPYIYKQKVAFIICTFDFNTFLFSSFKIIHKPTNKIFFINKGIKSINSKTYIIIGTFSDSLELNGFKPIYKKYIGSKSHTLFYAIYKNNIPYKIITFNDSTYWTSNVLMADVEDNYLFLAGQLFGDVNFESFQTKQIEGNNYFIKIDSLGNVIWPIRLQGVGGNGLNGFSFDNSKGVYFINNFNKSISINKTIYYSKDSSTDFIISKIYDYSISRGSVSKGPYCAGDTFNIPFTKDGVFDTANTFIAELSNENGDFTGGHRQLGKLKTNKDSTIKGILPLFDVVSSPLYRIRILSTKPQVQSYYRYDSLRLLIYSKDTANAGADTTVCNGARLKLKTSGGSRWRWSPGNLVVDSTARITQTKALTQTTIFRIIISDSSGCGKTDTAYKTINVIAPLKITNADTTLCQGTNTTLNLKAKGGLAAQYIFKWRNVDSMAWNNSRNIPLIGKGTHTYKIVLDDACSLIDSLNFQQTTYSMPKMSLANDTLVCPLNSITLSAIHLKDSNLVFTGKPPYLFKWRTQKANINSYTQSISHTFTNPDTAYVTLTDACSYIDTAKIAILHEQPLNGKIILNKACFADTAKLHFKPQGKRINKYIFQWQKSFATVGSDSILNYKTSNLQTQLIAKLGDNCNTPFYDTINLYPQALAKLNVIKNAVCDNNNEFVFINTAQLNDKLLQSYEWRYSNLFTPKLKDSASLKGSFNKAGSYSIQYHLTSQPNCTQIDSVKVTVYPKPPIEISWQRTTNTYDISDWRFIATSTFTLKSIFWDFGRLGTGSGSPYFKTFYVNDSIKAKVSITDALGCSNDSLFSFYLIHRKQFLIPNAITVNNDGINDEFSVPGAEFIKEFDLKIYNRWGELVFKSNNPLETWKPSNKMNNVYIYTLTIFDIYNERHLIKGVVEVIE